MHIPYHTPTPTPITTHKHKNNFWKSALFVNEEHLEYITDAANTR